MFCRTVNDGLKKNKDHFFYVVKCETFHTLCLYSIYHMEENEHMALKQIQLPVFKSRLYSLWRDPAQVTKAFRKQAPSPSNQLQCQYQHFMGSWYELNKHTAFRKVSHTKMQ